ncbi:MAG: C10 family peptidase [Mediterranea sp.]|jgi:hypothetical protein|nr:C10 family peptidase [Mediterranea sp.]
MKKRHPKAVQCSLIALSLIAAACTNDVTSESSVYTPPTPVSKTLTDADMEFLSQLRGKTPKVGVDEATNLANDAISVFGQGTATRGKAKQAIVSVSAITVGEHVSTPTRASETASFPDTVAYAFNYANGGYAIIAADKRITPSILAYADTGSSDTDNPGVALFLQNLKSYALKSISDFQQKKDSLTNSVVSKICPTTRTDTLSGDDYDINVTQGWGQAKKPDIPAGDDSSREKTTVSEGDYTSIEGVHPLLPVEWGQYFPFNELVKYNNCLDGTAPTGCVPLAIAQIMTYWQYPNSVDGHTMHWPILRHYTARPNAYHNVSGKDSIPATLADISGAECSVFAYDSSNLLEILGRHFKVHYACGDTEFYTGNIPLLINYLDTLGYSLTLSSNYNYLNVKASLNNGCPVFIGGENDLDEPFHYGHAWVIDGYQRLQKAIYTRVEVWNGGHKIFDQTTTTYTYGNYLHHNWGWYGDSNGYYAEGVFDSTESHLSSHLGELPTRTGGFYDFSHGIRILSNIHPDN